MMKSGEINMKFTKSMFDKTAIVILSLLTAGLVGLSITTTIFAKEQVTETSMSQTSGTGTSDDLISGDSNASLVKDPLAVLSSNLETQPRHSQNEAKSRVKRDVGAQAQLKNVGEHAWSDFQPVFVNGVSQVPSIQSNNVAVPGKNAFTPLLTKDTRYYDEKTGMQLPNGISPAYPGPYAMRVTHIGYYKGQELDMIYTILASRSDNTIRNATMYTFTADWHVPDKFLFQSTFGGGLKSGATYVNTVQFVKAGTNTPIQVSGTWTYGALSWNKFSVMNMNQYDGGRGPADSKILFYDAKAYNETGALYITANRGTGDSTQATSRFSEQFTTDKDGIYYMIIQKPSSYISLDVAYTSLFPAAVSPVDLPDPEITGVDNKNKDQQFKISWDAIQTLPNQPSSAALNAFKLTGDLPPLANVKESGITIKDVTTGTDLTGQFDITVADGQYQLVARIPSALMNRVIKISFSGKLDVSDPELLKHLTTDPDGDPAIKLAASIRNDYILFAQHYVSPVHKSSAYVGWSFSGIQIEPAKAFNFGNVFSAGRYSLHEVPNPVVKVVDNRLKKTPAQLELSQVTPIINNGAQETLNARLLAPAVTGKLTPLTADPLIVEKSRGVLPNLVWNDHQGNALQLILNQMPKTMGQYQTTLDWTVRSGD